MLCNRFWQFLQWGSSQGKLCALNQTPDGQTATSWHNITNKNDRIQWVRGWGGNKVNSPIPLTDHRWIFGWPLSFSHVNQLVNANHWVFLCFAVKVSAVLCFVQFQRILPLVFRSLCVFWLFWGWKPHLWIRWMLDLFLVKVDSPQKGLKMPNIKDWKYWKKKCKIPGNF